MSDITYINKDLLMEGILESKEGQVISKLMGFWKSCNL